MTSNKLFNRFYSMFCQEASKSNISSKLAAGVLKGKKLVGKVCCNTSRNICRGIECGSLHAEANALITYFGKSLQFNATTNKWCLRLRTNKECEKT